MCVKKQGNKAGTTLFNRGSRSSFELDTSKVVGQKNIYETSNFIVLKKSDNALTVLTCLIRSLYYTPVYSICRDLPFFSQKKKIQFRTKGQKPKKTFKIIKIIKNLKSKKKKKKTWLIQFMSWKLFWGVPVHIPSGGCNCDHVESHLACHMDYVTQNKTHDTPPPSAPSI
jgi:hypothetical protein